MSLQFVIDGYNIINNPEFGRVCKSSADPQPCLIDLIRQARLCGSPNNEVTVVFDGYPVPIQGESSIKVAFSRDESADEYIDEIVRTAHNPKNIVVVTNDMQVRSNVKAMGAAVMSVKEFISVKKKHKPGERVQENDEPGYAQRQRIDEELRKLWLK